MGATAKAQGTEAKLDQWASIKRNASTQQRKQQIKRKGNLQNGRKHLSDKGLFSKMCKECYNSIGVGERESRERAQLKNGQKI